MNPVQNQSSEQKRARYALETIEHHQHKDQAWQARYTSYVKSLPAMILSNGLGQSMAFFLSKASGEKDSPYGQLYKDIENWLCNPKGLLPEHKNLMTALTASDMNAYLAAQAESLAVLNWLKICRCLSSSRRRRWC